MRGLQRAASVCAGMLVLALPTVALGDGAQSAILGMWLTEGASAVVRMERSAGLRQHLLALASAR
jgi:hypothetical protein